MKHRIIKTVCIWTLLTLAFCAIVVVLAGRLHAQAPDKAPVGACVQVDAGSLIWTVQGWSLAMGDGQITVERANVRFWDGPLAVCLPPVGPAPMLWLPSRAWPSFAYEEWAPRMHLAHGDYDWIRRHHGEARTAQSGGWQDGDFGGCCGKQDCFPVKATFELRELEGKRVPGFKVEDEFGDFVPLGKPHSDVSRDPEGRHWRCYRMLGSRRAGPRTGCFFYQPGGG